MGEQFNHLTYAKRLKIEALLEAGIGAERIAQIVGVHKSTIYREKKRGRYVKRNSDWTESEKYSPEISEEKYRGHLREKGREIKLGKDMKFVKYIETKIGNEKYSPEATLLNIRREGLKFDTEICLSTLYNYIRKGYFINITMIDLPMRKPRTTIKKKRVQKRANRGESIENRPKDIETRKEFGHWEMDTVVGKKGETKSSLLVLTERKTRVEIVEKMNNHTMKEVVRTLDKLERRIGEKTFREIFKTITVDNGSEFSDTEGMQRSRRNKKNRTKVYYCHPYSSYERGSNENQNRMIRRHIPKGVDFDCYTNAQIKKIEEWINTYPRKMFGGMTSQEVCQAEFRRCAA